MAKRQYKNTHTLVAARRGLSKISIDIGHTEKQEYANAIEGVNYRRVYVKDATRTGEVELWINLDAILRTMGPDALRSKAKVAKRVNGLVQVRAVNINDTKV